MRKMAYGECLSGLYKKNKQGGPRKGELELTYRCNLRCPHCYLRPYQKNDYYQQELPSEFWKNLLDILCEQGCIHLTVTGGDPLLRKDFFEIYLYAKRKGFAVSIFTNALSLKADTVETFKKYCPYSIELTLNSLQEERFNAVTGTRGNFKKSLRNIERAVKSGLPVVLKSNGLKLNKNEISRIKTFARELLGENKYKFDSYILPGLNGDRTPLRYRLTPKEIILIEESDPEIKQFLTKRSDGLMGEETDRELFYKCNTWRGNFFVDPYGILRFCRFTDKFSTDLKKASFQEGFYKVFFRISEARYKNDAKCKYCDLAVFCLSCPSRNYLEIGDEEKSVAYFCQLAEEKATQRKRLTVKI